MNSCSLTREPPPDAFIVELDCISGMPVCRVTFALAEKDVPYDSVLIDLRAKPAWYREIVPTELTPAARINGELVWESMDILQVISLSFL